MTPEEQREKIAKMLDAGAKSIVEDARLIGIEYTKSEVEEIIRDAWKDAQKQSLTAHFLLHFMQCRGYGPT